MKRIAFALAPALLFALAIELAFRLADVATTPMQVPERESDETGTADETAADRTLGSGEPPAYLEPRSVAGVDYLYSRWLPSPYYRNDTDTSGRLMRAAKGENLYRVFALGGSSTAGSPYGNWASFSRFIRDELERAKRPGTEVEVMNLGLSGGRSHEALRLMRDMARYRPDLIIVYVGHNEACQLLSGSQPGLLAALTRHSAAIAYLAGWLAPTPKRPADPFGRFRCGAELTGPDALAEIEQRFSDNLGRLVGLARVAGADVLLLSQFSNLFMPPLDFAEPTDEAGEQARGLLASLAGAFEQQNLGAAEELLEAIRQLDPGTPRADYYEGLLRLNAGQAARARTLLVRALERDRSPRRFRPSYNAVLESLAEADPHVHFLDLLGLAGEQLDDRLIDGRWVVDVMHPTLEGQRFIAEMVLEHVKAEGVRPDLFDLGALQPERAYLPVEELDRYALICQRYYDLESWQECVDRAWQDHVEADLPARVGARRRARRVWENLFFYALATGEARRLQQSHSIYRSRTESVRDSRSAAAGSGTPGDAP